MDIWQLFLIFQSAFLFSLGFYFFLKSVFVHKLIDKYLYFSLSVLGASLFFFFEFLISTSIEPEFILTMQRLKITAMSLIMVFEFYCIYDVFFKKSFLPRLFSFFIILFSIFIPSHSFISTPILYRNYMFLGDVITLKVPSASYLFLAFTFISWSFFVFTLIKLVKKHTVFWRKFFGLLAVLPLVLIGLQYITDVLRLHIFKYQFSVLFILFPISMFIFFLSEEAQTLKNLDLSNIALKKEKKKAEHLLESFLMTLSSAIESRDKYTGFHVERVAKYSLALAKCLNLPEEIVRMIYLGAIVHDIGKIGIEDNILKKDTWLTDDEYKKMQEHTVFGKSILSKIPDFDIPGKIAYSHQEKWDGTGYPKNLKGDAIPLEARIVAIADYWDAITTNRPYRDAFSIEKALELMKKERGKSFDPNLLDIFIEKELYKA